MIIVNLKGGIGNQMFQYACGRALAQRNQDELKLEIDGLERANQQGDIYRPFSLGLFNIQATIATHTEVSALKYPWGWLSKIWRYISFRVLQRLYITYDPQVMQWTGDIFLDGYWQSERYASSVRDVLLDEFTLQEESQIVQQYQDHMTKTNSVSIHVRRGDYVHNSRVNQEFGLCSLEYYQKAIARMEQEVERAHYFVFSDDIEWAQDNLGLPKHTIFVTHPELRDVDELILMSCCKHNIIANSTFSWWGAYLNKNSDKTVIAPDPWYNTIAYDQYLIPESWILVPKQ